MHREHLDSQMKLCLEDYQGSQMRTDAVKTDITILDEALRVHEAAFLDDFSQSIIDHDEHIFDWSNKLFTISSGLSRWDSTPSLVTHLISHNLW